MTETGGMRPLSVPRVGDRLPRVAMTIDQRSAVGERASYERDASERDASRRDTSARPPSHGSVGAGAWSGALLGIFSRSIAVGCCSSCAIM